MAEFIPVSNGMKQQVRRKRRWVLLWSGLFGGSGALMVHYHKLLLDPFIILLAGHLLLGFFLLMKHAWKQYRILSAGASGERQVRSWLRSLPDTYRVYTSVPIDVDGRRTELDFLVAGPEKLHLIEAKNYAGVLSGSMEASSWKQQKGRYFKEVSNPVKQVKRQIHLLSLLLSENTPNRSPWIDGIICFLHPASDTSGVRGQTKDLPFVHTKRELLQALQESSGSGKLSTKEREALHEQMLQLKKEQR